MDKLANETSSSNCSYDQNMILRVIFQVKDPQGSFAVVSWLHGRFAAATGTRPKGRCSDPSSLGEGLPLLSRAHPIVLVLLKSAKGSIRSRMHFARHLSIIP